MLDSEKTQDSSSAIPAPVDQALALTDQDAGPTGSSISLNKQKDESATSISKSNTHSPRGDFISSLWIAQFLLNDIKSYKKSNFEERIYK